MLEVLRRARLDVEYLLALHPEPGPVGVQCSERWGSAAESIPALGEVDGIQDASAAATGDYHGAANSRSAPYLQARVSISN